VSYAVPQAGHVSLKLYDITGSLKTTLANGFCPAGNYTSRVSAERLARGIYIMKLETASRSETQKLIVE